MDLPGSEIATEMGGKIRLERFASASVEVLSRTASNGYSGFLRRARAIYTAMIGGLVVIPLLAIFFLSDGANLMNSLIRLATTEGKP